MNQIPRTAPIARSDGWVTVQESAIVGRVELRQSKGVFATAIKETRVKSKLGTQLDERPLKMAFQIQNQLTP